MTSTTDLLDGRYRLVRLLGQGGMSDVYEAIDERSDTAVAIKFVRSADPELARRFAQEVRALGRVEHPGLVRLIGTGLAGDHAYLVMELVQGSTLAEALRHGPLGPERTAYLGASLAGALAYVHSRGVVHRDVKPSNILLHADGRAQLGDFGVARLLDASALTMAGTTLGTAAYMAPEQLEDHQVGAAADIWSLGMVLLECLTGHRVYEGSTAQVVAKRMAGPVPLPGDLPVPWKLLLSGMLDHRPGQRLEGADVAALLVTSPFRAAWSPSPSPDAAPPPSTERIAQVVERRLRVPVAPLDARQRQQHAPRLLLVDRLLEQRPRVVDATLAELDLAHRRAHPRRARMDLAGQRLVRRRREQRLSFLILPCCAVNFS